MSCDPSLQKKIGPQTKSVVVGLGSSGLAAARLLRHLGAAVRVLEKDPARIKPDFAAWAAANNVQIITGAHSAQHFAGANLVVPSPGVAQSVLAPFLPAGADLISETELAWRQLEGEPILTVTGTSGKTTTTLMCALMLEERNLSVFTGGNIGTPLSQYVLERKGLSGTPRARADVLVLELSSFQLQTSVTLRPRVAILLNLSENHLDYHADMAEYITAKMRIFRCQGVEDLALFNKDLQSLASRFEVRARIACFNPNSANFPDLKLPGAHNQANAEAAFMACREFGVSRAQAAKALSKFKGLPHRLELVADFGGVKYVNDSKCTTADALRVALEAFAGPIILLAGGKFKGGDLTALKDLVQSKVKHVALYGASREIFEQAWHEAAALSWNETLAQALDLAASKATGDDTILLAPATSSYDQYPNYEERGTDFKKSVLKLMAYGSAQ